MIQLPPSIPPSIIQNSPSNPSGEQPPPDTPEGKAFESILTWAQTLLMYTQEGDIGNSQKLCEEYPTVVEPALEVIKNAGSDVQRHSDFINDINNIEKSVNVEGELQSAQGIADVINQVRNLKEWF